MLEICSGGRTIEYERDGYVHTGERKQRVFKVGLVEKKRVIGCRIPNKLGLLWCELPKLGGHLWKLGQL